MGTADVDPCRRFDERQAVCRAPEISEQAWHRVRLSTFLIDATEVTNLQYIHCAQDGPCEASLYAGAGAPGEEGIYLRRYASSPTYYAYPVVNVTHAQAEAYCAWKGGRLPTEAEWEYAGRGAGGTARDAWPWGASPDPTAACVAEPRAVGFGECSHRQPWPVGRAALDRRGGLFDLLGNAAEWVLDAWDPLAFCDGASRALFSADPTKPASFPHRTDPAALDGLCAESPGCLTACDDQRFDCLAACEACRGTGGDYGACLVQSFCLQRCGVATECRCAGGDPPGCAPACDCHADCVAAAPVADAPDRCLAACYATAEASCRAAGCLADGCRTFCGEPGKESNRLCRVRDAGGQPVEAPLVTAHPPGLEDTFVVKGGSWTTAAEDACELRIGARRPVSGVSPTVGFRCAYDLPAGQTDCP